MSTLQGLPAVERYPRATVARADERTLISFAGEGGTREVEVDLRSFGEVDDLEQTELQLLARLQQIGYRVEWLRSEEDGDDERSGGQPGPGDAPADP